MLLWLYQGLYGIGSKCAKVEDRPFRAFLFQNKDNIKKWYGRMAYVGSYQVEIQEPFFSTKGCWFVED